MKDVRGRLDDPRRVAGVRPGSPDPGTSELSGLEPDVEERGPLDRFESLLSQSPALAPVDALPFYDEAERASFARSRWVGDPPSGREDAALVAPFAVAADHEAGAVTLRWEADPATVALGDGLPDGQRLAWRLYRGRQLDEPTQVVELPFEARRWRDDDLPLAASRMTYIVWAALLDGERLLAAEPGDPVSVAVPERFVLTLEDGDAERARFRLTVGPAAQPVASARVEAAPGEPVATDGLPTELILESLSIVDQERLQTRSRLQFRADGSLVLDPDTGAPRRTETQVLVSVRRLIATLRDSFGVPRTLEVDLP